MLYTKIRHAEAIRKLYKLRHLLELERHPEIGSRLGYKKYSRHYYQLKKKLKDEKILDKEGRFIESLTNKWITELPITVQDPKLLQVLGTKSTFNLFLSSFFVRQTSVNELKQELHMNTRTIYDRLKKLNEHSCIFYFKSNVEINEKSKMHYWLSKYLEYSLTQADAEGDISILFDSVLAYIDGPQAYYITNYEPGRTIGPANMIIRTSRFFEKFWQYALRRISYFTNYPKKIIVLPQHRDAKIIWLNELPYNEKATEEF